MLQRTSPLSRLPRAARREIATWLATDPDIGEGVEQEPYALDDHLDVANQIPEEPHAAAHAKPAALHVVPCPSLWSRIWNWVPGGRVAHGEFSLDSLFSSRRR